MHPIVNLKNREKKMIRVTAEAAAYIAERGGNLTLYSKILSS
jgi:hypothetical protein